MNTCKQYLPNQIDYLNTFNKFIEAYGFDVIDDLNDDFYADLVDDVNLKRCIATEILLKEGEFYRPNLICSIEKRSYKDTEFYIATSYDNKVDDIVCYGYTFFKIENGKMFDVFRLLDSNEIKELLPEIYNDYLRYEGPAQRYLFYGLLLDEPIEYINLVPIINDNIYENMTIEEIENVIKNVWDIENSKKILFKYLALRLMFV